jgi:hypothetical protein
MTLTERDLQEFNIDRFIDQASELDGPEMLLRCLNFAVLVEGIDLKLTEHGYLKERVVNFTRFITHLQIILTKDNKNHHAYKPIGMSEENFSKIKPIVEKLAASGYLKKDWLELYDPVF